MSVTVNLKIKRVYLQKDTWIRRDQKGLDCVKGTLCLINKVGVFIYYRYNIYIFIIYIWIYFSICFY